MTNNDILKDCFAVFTCTCYTVHGKALADTFLGMLYTFHCYMKKQTNTITRTFDQQSVLFRMAGTV